MSKRAWETFFKNIGVLVVVSMLLGALPAGASASPKAVSWEEYAAGLASASSPQPATVTQDARFLSVRDYALLIGAEKREVVPPPAASSDYPILLPLDEHPITDEPVPAQGNAAPSPDTDTTAPLMPSNPPKTTYDRLPSGAPMPTADAYDDTGKASPNAGGRLKSSDRWLDVQFPAKAVTQPVTLTYKTRGFSPHPLIAGRDTYFAFGLKATTASSVNVTKFDVPLAITITYPANVYVSPEADVFYWDESTQDWVWEPTANHDPEKRTIVIRPEHLTDYAISDANQIQPDLPKLDGFSTDQFTGASNVNVPIETLSGPNGMAPRLSLSYNSQDKAANAGQYDQASNIGWGWSLNGIPYIIQTPRMTHNQANQSILAWTYNIVLDGISSDLVQISNATNPVEYGTMNESFAKILFYPGSTQYNGYWIVTTKDGTQYKFEDPWSNSVPYSRNYFNVGTYCTDYEWRYSATAITDTVGMTMTVSYTRETGTSDCFGSRNVTKAIHPDVITWDKGKYRVKFNTVADRADFQDSQQQAQKRIKEIVVQDWGTGSTQQIRKYTLITNTLQTSFNDIYYNRTVLKKVQKTGEVGTSQSPAITTTMVFTYSTDQFTRGSSSDQVIVLKKVDNGFSGVSWFQYESVPDTVDGLATWQMRVITRTESDGRGNSYDYTYDYGGSYVNSSAYSDEANSSPPYSDMLLHRPTAAYWGHKWVTVTDPEGNVTKTWFNIGDTLKGKETEVRQAGPSITGNLYITRTTSYYNDLTDVKTYNYPWHYVKQVWTAQDKVVTRNFENTGSGGDYKETMVEYVYDSYGDVKQVQDNGDTSVSGDEKTTFRNYFDDSTHWIKDRVYWERVFAGIGSGGTLLSRVRYYYDNDDSSQTTSLTKGLLTHTMVYTDSSHTVDTRYGYDSYGNQTVITDTRGYATTTDYDTTYHLYPVKTTNPLGQEKNIGYDWTLGKPTEITDANGNVTQFAYDTQGNVVALAKQGDDLGSPTLSVDLSGYYNTSPAQQSFIIGQKGSSTITTWFDGMGRTYQTSETGPGSQCYVQQKTFDFASQVISDSLPFLKSTCPTQYVTPPAGTKFASYEYDPLGRTTVVTNTDNTVNTTSYVIPSAAPEAKSKQVAIDPNGHKKAYYRDPNDKLIKVEEFQGNSSLNYSLYATTDYTYDLVGNLTGVEDEAGNDTSMTYDWAGRKLTMSDVDMGSYSYGYDAAGNLTSQVDASGNVLNFQYDQLNRLTTQLEGATPIITYTYDSASVTNGKGQRTGMQDASGSTTWNYNPRGKVSREDKTISNINYSTSYTYDSLERVATTTYPGGEVITNTYSTSGLLNQVSSSLGDKYLYDATYNALKLPTLTKHNSTGSLQVNYEYFSDNYRLKRIYGMSALANDLDLNYTYDDVGNVASFTDSSTERGGESASFGYDSLDRLISATGAYDQAWAYDTIGNMTVFTRTTTPYNYTYGDSAHNHAATQVAYNDGTAKTDSYSYDARGNMTGRTENGITYTQTFNKENQLTQVISGTTTTTFLYDGDGQRVQKQVDDGSKVVTTMYVGNILERVYTTITNTVSTDIKYYYAGGKRIAMRDSDGVKYMFGDHLGSTALVTDGSGNRLMRQGYFPYGEVRYLTGSSKTDYGFTGQKSDDSTGLMYYGIRYYDPRLGRFASADTIVPTVRELSGCPGIVGSSCSDKIGPLTTGFNEPMLIKALTNENKDSIDKISSLDEQVRSQADKKKATGPTDSEALNRYAYVLNNPVGRTDPDGHMDEPKGHFGTKGNSYIAGWKDDDGYHYEITLAPEDVEALKNSSDRVGLLKQWLQDAGKYNDGEAIVATPGPIPVSPAWQQLDAFLGKIAGNLDNFSGWPDGTIKVGWFFTDYHWVWDPCWGWCGHYEYDNEVLWEIPNYVPPGGPPR